MGTLAGQMKRMNNGLHLPQSRAGPRSPWAGMVDTQVAHRSMNPCCRIGIKDITLCCLLPLHFYHLFYHKLQIVCHRALECLHHLGGCATSGTLSAAPSDQFTGVA
ncbi:hypothetical protein Fot_49355 [Forsythia ovata]|uniref:Uncharacterized protein n=1 Tax=Forsythia ovata TaxID=205694 RepID=A0ABD1QF31_9LAMI